MSLQDRSELIAGMSDKDLEQIRSDVWESGHEGDRADHLKKLSSLTKLLDYHAAFPHLTKKELSTCLEMGDTLINLLGIRSRHHKLSEYRSRFYQAKSKLKLLNSNIQGSVWNDLMSEFVSPSNESQNLIETANKLLRLGLIQQAKTTIQRIEGYDAEALEAILKRWEGQEKDWSQYRRINFVDRWQIAVGEAQFHGDLSSLEDLVKKGGTYYSSDKILEFCLWSMSVKSRAWLGKQVRVTNLRRRRGLENIAEYPLYSLIDILQNCYDFERPLSTRIDALGYELENTSKLQSVEHELLAWLASYRWLSRSKAKDFALFCLERYKNWSLVLSKGQRDDLLCQLQGEI